MKLFMETCPMFGDTCRHCSKKIVRRPYTRIKLNTTLHIYEPDGRGNTIVDAGHFCNNHPEGTTGMVDEMHYCPARWGLHRGRTITVPKRGRPKKAEKS